MFSMEEIVDLAVRIEENGEKVYRTAAGKVPDPALAALLGWLADEEVRHVEWFSELRKRVKEGREDPHLREMGMKILREIVGEKSFSLDEADFSTLEGSEGLVKLALDFEQDTLLFYEMLAPFIDDQDGTLKRILEEEKRHIQALGERLPGAQGRSTSGGFVAD